MRRLWIDLSVAARSPIWPLQCCEPTAGQTVLLLPCRTMLLCDPVLALTHPDRQSRRPLICIELISTLPLFAALVVELRFWQPELLCLGWESCSII